jgi:hypothetical protein
MMMGHALTLFFMMGLALPPGLFMGLALTLLRLGSSYTGLCSDYGLASNRVLFYPLFDYGACTYPPLGDGACTLPLLHNLVSWLYLKMAKMNNQYL